MATPQRNHRDLPRTDKKRAVNFSHALIRQGVYCTPDGKLYLSLAHTEENIDRAIELAGCGQWPDDARGPISVLV
jgi:glutamate-1-semialdehyde aminotransferase